MAIQSLLAAPTAALIALTTLGAPTVARAGEGGYVVVVNGTNQAWEMYDKREPYQVDAWTFPQRLAAGETKKVYVEFKSRKKGHMDTNASAKYRFADTKEPAVQFIVSQDDHGSIDAVVDVPTALPTSTSARKQKLGWRHDGNVNFILAGRKGQYMTTGMDGSDWMKRQRHMIGNWTLGNICMPGTHDSGMYKSQFASVGASDGLVVTQTKDILGQLKRGARYFDVRPSKRNGTYYAAHLQGGRGGYGQEIEEIAKNINQFLTEQNGRSAEELIIVNLSHGDNMDDDAWADVVNIFKGKIGSKLINLQGHYERNWVPHRMTFNRLLKYGNVLLLVDGPKYTINREVNPNLTEFSGKLRGAPILQVGFDYGDKDAVYNSDFPIFDKYSNSKDFKSMAADQIKKLETEKFHVGYHSSHPFFVLSWTLTQQWIDLSNPTVKGAANTAFNLLGTNNSILELADETNHHLTAYIYPVVTDKAFPNVLYIDAFDFDAGRDVQATTLAAAINWKRELQFPR